ncbi:MAG: hypothetical protein DMG59_15775 [Acidobacteria bacterium]|nr:MAG: hypothetical protein DMG59_15775 [Acidobacteriota bacterium]
MKRLLITATLLVATMGVAAPWLPVDFVRPKIARALESGLGRRVEIGGVHFSLFTGPGFTLDDVTIHEDARAGIEPFAYVQTLEARVRLASLFRRRLEFSSLRLTSGASINLVKTDAGPWNFQFLLSGTPASQGTMPAIRMRSGRVNFKFGDTKSVFYFRAADLDVAPSANGSVDLRFAGAPSRTDRSAQDFGYFFVRGAWNGQKLDMRVELERSAVEEVARLIDRRGFGVHGIIALDAQLSGPPSHLEITGQVQVDDVHRWDLLPKRGGGWRAGYKGMLDLREQRLEIESTSDATNSPLAVRFRAWDFLSTPHWDASADLNQVPLATLVEVARHMGAAFPATLAAEGSVSGSVRYSEPAGLSGRVALEEASLTLPDAEPLRASTAALVIARNALQLEPSTVQIGEDQSADVEGSYMFEGENDLDLKITTRGMNVSDLRSLGLTAIPLLEQTPQGTWRGWARYHWARDAAGEWSGEYELQNARVAVLGLADPLRILSAAVSLNGARVSVSRLRAKVGTVEFSGDYRWEPTAVRPHKFHITIPEAEDTELERILMPTMIRERGFFARTLRLGAARVPEWLKTRRADGAVSIESLTVADTVVRIDSARLLWDASLVRLTGVSGHLDEAAVAGDLEVDLRGNAPHYRFEGKVEDTAYKGGKLDFEGSLEADGVGADLLASARAEGRLHGRSIAFTPEADFQSVAGCFEMLASAGGPRWKFSGLEVTQGGDTYTGTGATQADGRLVLELTNRTRQLRYTAPLFAMTPQL